MRRGQPCLAKIWDWGRSTSRFGEGKRLLIRRHIWKPQREPREGARIRIHYMEFGNGSADSRTASLQSAWCLRSYDRHLTIDLEVVGHHLTSSFVQELVLRLPIQPPNVKGLEEKWDQARSDAPAIHGSRSDPPRICSSSAQANPQACLMLSSVEDLRHVHRRGGRYVCADTRRGGDSPDGLSAVPLGPPSRWL